MPSVSCTCSGRTGRGTPNVRKPTNTDRVMGSIVRNTFVVRCAMTDACGEAGEVIHVPEIGSRVVHALLAPHRLKPTLHKVPEKEVPLFNAPKHQSPADDVIFDRARTPLESLRVRISRSRLK